MFHLYTHSTITAVPVKKFTNGFIGNINKNIRRQMLAFFKNDFPRNKFTLLPPPQKKGCVCGGGDFLAINLEQEKIQQLSR